MELQKLPDELVDCIVCSPPYFSLRQYLFDDAVIWAYNISNEEKQYIKKELKKRGIAPKQKW
uniref:Uncharacterized protein n=2 Tax=viral metagenome TaxID=1070528 RepID=A0A6M3MCW4_9ZZZZ